MTGELPTTCIVGTSHLSAAVAKAFLDCGLPFERHQGGVPLEEGSGGAGGTGALAHERLDHVRRIDNGAWSLHPECGPTRFFDALVVTTRPRLSPRIPRIAGSDGFSGASYHSDACPGVKAFRRATVLVVGDGHRAETVALELAEYAHRVLLASAPCDDSVRLSRPGRFARYVSLCCRPTISMNRLSALAGRSVRLVGEPLRIDRQAVFLADGSSAGVDAIVYATGFSPQFGFLSPALQSAGGHEFELYKRVFRPAIDSLFFVGSFLPAEATAAAAMQAVLVTEYLRGSYVLPDLFAMRNQRPYDRGRTARGLFDVSTARSRPALARYARELECELRRGRRRALRRGAQPPLPAIAAGLRPPEEPLQKPAESRAPLLGRAQALWAQKEEQDAAPVAVA